MDVTTKEGNREKVKWKGGIGLISSRLLLEGPLLKKRGSFAVSGRTAYLGLLLLPQRVQYNAGKANNYSGYNLYDYNIKTNLDIGKKSHLYYSFYYGKDLLDIRSRANDINESLTNLNWGNKTHSLRYSHPLGKASFLKIQAIRSDFEYDFKVKSIDNLSSSQHLTQFGNRSALSEWTGSIALDWKVSPKHLLKTGADLSWFSFTPEDVFFQSTVDSTEFGQTSKSVLNATQAAFFIEDEWNISQKLSFLYGFRVPVFNIRNKTYQFLEPRLSGRYLILPSMAIKAGYAENNQIIHLITNSGLGLQNDIWIPATQNLPPGFSRQYSFGLIKTLDKQGIELTLEFYQKWLRNQVEYAEGTTLFSSIGEQDWESKLEAFGKGQSKGVEFGLQKESGKVTGLFAYTWSKTNRQFEQINAGRAFPFKYDFRHNLNATANYKISEKWDLSASFVYRSGQPFSCAQTAVTNVPESQYEPASIAFFAERNNVRLPDYIRLDAGINYSKKKKKGRIATWGFSIYNATNRNNVYYAFLKNEGQFDPIKQEFIYNPKIGFRSLLPILPSISYSIR